MRVSRLVLAGFVGVLPLSACGGGDDSGGSGGSGGVSGTCKPTAAECYVSGPSGPGSECMAKFDNSGAQVWQGRITGIDVKTPPVLASTIVQVVIIDDAISLALPNCNETGTGTFGWLFELDSTTKKLKTGGSLPVTNPQEGGCFVTLTNTPVPIQPIEVDVTLDADGLGFTANDIDVNVPIFDSPSDTTNPIILPLKKVDIVARYNDASHNCIGHYNVEGLEIGSSCASDAKLRAWVSGGTLKGHITVEDADKVWIKEMTSSLCPVLAGSDFKGPDGYCKSSTKWAAGDRPAGDWCAGTNLPSDGTCKDAWALEGAISTAGFKINGNCGG